MTPVRFNFRLDRLRWLRQLDERDAQERLVASLGRQGEGERSLRRADAAVEGARGAALEAGAAPDATAADLLATATYLERVAGERTAAAQELDRRAADVEQRRRELSAAASRRNALDRLRDRQRADHQRAAERAESGRLDELALAVHRRGTRK